MSEYNEIYFNVWDDYWDDCTEKKQDTHGYVESDESEEEQAAIAKLVADWINANLELPSGMTVEAEGIYVQFDNMSHEFREGVLMPRLGESGLEYNGKSFKFYSES